MEICTSSCGRHQLVSSDVPFILTSEFALPHREEVFGPVFTILKFKKDADAIALANACPFGLGSTVFSGSKARANKIAYQLQVRAFSHAFGDGSSMLM